MPEWSVVKQFAEISLPPSPATGGSLLDYPVGTTAQRGSTLHDRLEISGFKNGVSRTRECSKSRFPETPKNLISSPRPFALVLDVILIHLNPFPTKSDQNLVPDGGAGFCVTAAELLHHILRDLGRKRRLGRSAPRRGLIPFARPGRECIGVYDTDPPLLNAAEIGVVRFELSRGGKTGIVGGDPWGRTA